METKKWYASKTVWGGILVIVSLILRALNISELTPEEQSQIVDKIVSVVNIGMESIGAVLVIIGRIKAEKKLTR